MRILMVSTYPPTHCGIGAYADQSVAQLRAQGHVVDVMSPDEQGNVDMPCDLRGGAKLLQLFKLLRYYDKVIVQYHWAFFYLDPSSPQHRGDTLKTILSFILLFLRSRKIEVVAHEIPFWTGRLRRLYGWQWKLVPKLVLHTQQERARLEQHYHLRLSDTRLEFRSHAQVYQEFSAHTRTSGRQHLRLRSDRLIFLCIGFIQPHKGFDRALRAFVQAGIPNADLFIVGSLRIDDTANRKYLADLYRMAEGHPGIHIAESFVSNEEFDTWIAASDWVVLPYSEIWSSAVLGRANLLCRPAIVSAVGGLPDQARENDLLFSSDEELVSAFQAAAMSLAQSRSK